MKISELILAMALFGLTSCNEDSKSTRRQTIPKKSKSLPNEYSTIQPLNFSYTNETVSNEQLNTVSLEGAGAESTYKINYHFYSAGAARFKVIETVLKSCAASSEMVLKDAKGARRINFLEKYVLKPQTAYILEVNFKSDCEKQKIKFSVIAWAGAPEADPKIASQCHSNQLGTTTFFESVGIIEAYSSITERQRFLSFDTYCGEGFRGAESKCSELGGREDIDGVQTSSIVCEARAGDQTRGFKLEIGRSENDMSLICDRNGVETDSYLFDNCRRAIVDYREFERD